MRHYPVTVVMPMFNAERYVSQAVKSILRQSLSAFQFMIVDDHSTDTSCEQVKQAGGNDSRILLTTSPGKGQVDALNDGWQRSTSPYIAIMHADDLAEPHRLERQLAFMETRSEVGAIGTDVSLLIDGRKIARPWSLRVAEHYKDVDRKMLFESPIRHPTAMIRREVLKKVGGYRQAFVAAEDYDLWLRIREHMFIANVAQPLLQYRIHNQQVTQQQARQLVISKLAADCSQRLREQGQPDLFDTMTLATEESLASFGVIASQIDAATSWGILTRERAIAGYRKQWLRWTWLTARLGLAQPRTLLKAIKSRLIG